MEPRSHEHLSAERIQAFLDGELPSGEVAMVEAHLAGCARCTEEFVTWRGLFHDLSAVPKLVPSQGFSERVLAAVERPARLPLAARLRRRAEALSLPPRHAHVPSERLQELLDGALPARHVAHVHEHVGWCGACARELDAWRSIYARLSGLEGYAPSPGFAERVLARLRTARTALPVPAWRRAFAAVQRLLPRTRRAWAAISGVAVTPAVTVALVIYTLFSHPTLTPQALASFAIWKLTDLVAAGWTTLSQAALAVGQVSGLGALVNLFIDAPWAIAGGALAYSVLSVLALRVLYKNLMGGRRHARLSFR